MQQRILAVDDEPQMLRLLERIISEKTPYGIQTTSSPLEVPQILEREPPFDLILTDLKMPGMDGLDILRMIKDQNRTEEVIIITAFGSVETAIEALSRDVFDYITKPFKKEQITFTVEKAMRYQRLKRQAAQQAEILDHEPFAEALRAFEHEYVRRLARRCEDDRNLMAQRSGMTQEALAAALEQAAPRG